MPFKTIALFNRAKKAQSEDKLPEFLSGLVGFCVFDNDEAAQEAFNAAVTSERTAAIAVKRKEGIEEGTKILDGFSWKDTVVSMLRDVADKVEIPDSEGNVSPWSVSLTIGDNGGLVSRLATGSVRSSSVSSPRSSGGKAKLDGVILTAKMLRDVYPHTIAGRIAIAKMAPHGIATKRNGEAYGEQTRFNATQAVKADPELSKRLTFDA